MTARCIKAGPRRTGAAGLALFGWCLGRVAGRGVRRVRRLWSALAAMAMLAAPAAAVTPAKQRRLIRTAEYYLQHTGQSDEPVRFDVAEVTPLDSGRWMVHIIKGAFTA